MIVPMIYSMPVVKKMLSPPSRGPDIKVLTSPTLCSFCVAGRPPSVSAAWRGDAQQRPALINNTKKEKKKQTINCLSGHMTHMAGRRCRRQARPHLHKTIGAFSDAGHKCCLDDMHQTGDPPIPTPKPSSPSHPPIHPRTHTLMHKHLYLYLSASIHPSRRRQTLQTAPRQSLRRRGTDGRTDWLR